MEANYKTADGRIIFKVNGETPKALFAEIAAIQDLFEAEIACGVCGGVVIRYQVRNVEKDGKKYKYHELVCRNHECRARFGFGQAMEGGGLFPKRKDADGNWLPNRGWEKYERAEQQSAPQQSRQLAPPPSRGGQGGGW